MEKKATQASSELFQPYRAVGFVCGDIPCHIKTLGKDSFLTVAVGKAWHVYKVSDRPCGAVQPDHGLTD